MREKLCSPGKRRCIASFLVTTSKSYESNHPARPVSSSCLETEQITVSSLLADTIGRISRPVASLLRHSSSRSRLTCYMPKGGHWTDPSQRGELLSVFDEKRTGKSQGIDRNTFEAFLCPWHNQYPSSCHE